MTIEKDKSLKCLNTFGIEAKASLFAEYSLVDELKSILKETQLEYNSNDKDDLKILHIGGGSNLLFLSDYEGLVLHSGIKTVEVMEETDSHVCVRVGGGLTWDDWVRLSIERGWYGLENLTAIPGEVGASAVQNIGAYGVEAKDFIVRVHLLDLRSLDIVCMENADLHYDYRYSILKSKELWGKYAVTHVDFKLSKTFVPNLEYGALKSAVSSLGDDFTLSATLLRQIIREMRDGKLPDPKVLGNAGSFFMNPVVKRSFFENLLEKYPKMPYYVVDEEHVKIPAGWLIETAGWKGRQLGKAGVYEKQALVLVNLGGATGQDIIRLCNTVKDDVKKMFDIDIHPEVNFIS